MYRDRFFWLTTFSLLAMTTSLYAQDSVTRDSPAAHFDVIRKEFDSATQSYLKRLQAAKSIAEQGKIFREENPQPAFAVRFLGLAKKHPKDPAAYAVLTWIVQNSEFGPAAEKPYAEAATLLASQYLNHKDFEQHLERMVNSPFVASGQFLQTVFEKHPSGIVRGRAGFSLGLYWKNYIATVEKLRSQADFAKNVELFVGPEMFAQLQNTDTTQLRRKMDELFTRIQKDHALVAYKKTTLGKAAEAELFEMRHLTVGKAAPDIEGEDTDSKSLKLSEYRGKVVVLVFWGTWCPHCRGMYEQERALAKRYEGQPFALVGVNSDESREKLKPVLAKERITWRSFWDGGNSDGPIARRWNVQGWPTVYVLDRDGVIRFKHVRDEALDLAVAELMMEGKGTR